MCVAVAGRVVSVDGASALVEVDGAKRQVSALMLPGLQAGEHVLVSLGMALERITEDEARSLEGLWRDVIAAQDPEEEGDKR